MGSDTNTASELEGRIQESLGEFQKKQLEKMIEGVTRRGDRSREKVAGRSAQGVRLCDDPVGRRKTHVLYNPEERFIDYVVPGVIGIILQLLTVTLTACTIARERESGTLYQLMVTSLRRERDRDRQDSALSRDFDSPHSGRHRRRGLAFSCPLSSTPCPRR